MRENVNLVFVTPTLQTRGARVSLLELIGGIKKTEPAVKCVVGVTGAAENVDWAMWERYDVRSNIIHFPTTDHLKAALSNPKLSPDAIIWHETPGFNAAESIPKNTPWVLMPRTPKQFDKYDEYEANQPSMDMTLFPSRYCMGTYNAARSNTVRVLHTGIDTEYYARFFRPWSERKHPPSIYGHPDKGNTQTGVPDHKSHVKRMARTRLLLAVDPSECFGRMPVEAACMGVPTLAIPEGALPELRERGLPITFWGEDTIEAFETMGMTFRGGVSDELQEAAEKHFDHKDYARRFLQTLRESALLPAQNGKVA